MNKYIFLFLVLSSVISFSYGMLTDYQKAYVKKYGTCTTKENLIDKIKTYEGDVPESTFLGFVLKTKPVVLKEKMIGCYLGAEKVDPTYSNIKIGLPHWTLRAKVLFGAVATGLGLYAARNSSIVSSALKMAENLARKIYSKPTVVESTPGTQWDYGHFGGY